MGSIHFFRLLKTYSRKN